MNYGVVSEKKVEAWLRGHGLRVERRQYNSPHDMLVNGKRVEIKTARKRLDGVWAVNIHRHGKVDETGTDFYIFRLERIPGFKYAIHLVVPSPVATPTINFSLRSLLTRWGVYFNRLDLLGGVRPAEDEAQ